MTASSDGCTSSFVRYTTAAITNRDPRDHAHTQCCLRHSAVQSTSRSSVCHTAGQLGNGLLLTQTNYSWSISHTTQRTSQLSASTMVAKLTSTCSCDIAHSPTTNNKSGYAPLREACIACHASSTLTASVNDSSPAIRQPHHQPLAALHQ